MARCIRTRRSTASGAGRTATCRRRRITQWDTAAGCRALVSVCIHQPTSPQLLRTPPPPPRKQLSPPPRHLHCISAWHRTTRDLRLLTRSGTGLLRAAPVQRDTDWSSVAETAEAAAGFYNDSVAEKAVATAELSRGGSVSDKTYAATAVALPSVADTAVTATAVPLVSVAESAETATAFSRWSVSAETAAADAGNPAEAASTSSAETATTLSGSHRQPPPPPRYTS